MSVTTPCFSDLPVLDRTSSVKPSTLRVLGVRVRTLARCLVALSLLIGSERASAQQQPQTHPDQRCLDCHGQAHIGELSPDERLLMVATRVSPGDVSQEEAGSVESGDDAPATRPNLYIPRSKPRDGVHANIFCVECHEDALQLPHARKLNLTTCATNCHEQEALAYGRGRHGEGLDGSPRCSTCHGGHDIVAILDSASQVSRFSGLALCGDCHEHHQDTPNGHESGAFVASYLASTHAKAFWESGLTSAAMCIDCHSAHEVRTADDPLSRVHRENIPETCGSCHSGIVTIYAESIHGKRLAEGDEKAPVCTDCHTAHSITRSGTAKFMLDVVNECGECHDNPENANTPYGTYYRTYLASYHGQVNTLGSTRAARCSDCHGSHDIAPLSDAASRVHPDNLIKTCGQAGCHTNANASFVRFDPHADYRDAEDSPVLYGVWIYFIVMMSTVFAFFGIHTILWFIRSGIERLRNGPRPTHLPNLTAIRRFSRLNRVNHGLVILTFMGLSATGVLLAFAGESWAGGLAWIFGGVELAGIWHRCFGFLLMINIVVHCIGVYRTFRKRRQSSREWAFGPNSLVPSRRDVTDCTAMFRWFVRGGKMPRFGRWTYFEKFDYWCEIGGSAIIGGTGLLLWFPELSSRILPGEVFNIAMVVHGYEALLAMGFIFTIHFFNANLRPEKFPVDGVIFSGYLPEAELAEERPDEYEQLRASGELDSLRVPVWPRWKVRTFMIVGICAMTFATGLLALIIMAGVKST